MKEERVFSTYTHSVRLISISDDSTGDDEQFVKFGETVNYEIARDAQSGESAR